MSGLQKRWQRLNERYLARSRRERGLIAIALIAGPFLIGKSLFVDPLSMQRKALEANVGKQLLSEAEMQAQLTTLRQQMDQDPDAGRKAELTALLADRERLDKQIREFGAALVPPQEMNDLLERLLARQSGLRLLSLKTLAPQSVIAGEQAMGKANGGQPAERVFDLYRHGVELRVEGGYRELQSYLAQLEKLDKHLLWGNLNYRVREYPRAEMTLTVYTLSPERTWLAL